MRKDTGGDRDEEAAVSPNPRRVTSYEVARLAGVSQSGVSRVFKPGASASAEMRHRVLAAASALGYQPNAIARTLTTGRSNMVGIIISDLTNLYFPEVLSELAARFSRHGKRVLLFTLPHEAGVDRIIGDVVGYQLDGIVSAARLSADQVSAFLSRGCPVILYNRSLGGVAAGSVCCDQNKAARRLADGLVDTGHRRIGFIGGPADSTVGRQRSDAFAARLAERGIRTTPFVESDFSYAGGHAAMLELAGRAGSGLDAVVCANDMMAIGALDATRHALGRRVPEEMSIAGFDGIDPARWDSYRITTVRQPVRRMTEAAVRMLLDQIADPARPPVRRVLPGELIVRDTVRGLAPSGDADGR